MTEQQQQTCEPPCENKGIQYGKRLCWWKMLGYEDSCYCAHSSANLLNDSDYNIVVGRSEIIKKERERESESEYEDEEEDCEEEKKACYYCDAEARGYYKDNAGNLQYSCKDCNLKLYIDFEKEEKEAQEARERVKEDLIIMREKWEEKERVRKSCDE